MKKFTVLLLTAAMVLTACTRSSEQPIKSEQSTAAEMGTEQSKEDGATLTPVQQAFLNRVETSYSYDLALRLTEIRSNERLGYRTAGSAAELAAGDLLLEEMKKIGLQNVVKEEFTLDTWNFHHADLTFTTADGTPYQAVLGGYQTQFDTEGPQEFSVVYAGRGTEADLAELDVTGKLVLIDINQREEWWISYPAYEAHLAGAAAVLAAQDGGYAEINQDALNAQDICGPADAPAFSISRTDADVLKALLEDTSTGELTVTLDAQSQVGFDGTSYNIVGTIPGRRADQMILMSAHYDSYFDGFQDDNAAIALMMGIAKAIKESGYQPEKTLVFCALAAEEWGVSDTRYDWSTGAYNQIFRIHPEWAGKVMADINFELPAYSLGYETTQMRTSYELQSFIESFAQQVPGVDGVFPKGIEVIVPTQTWSDDFSFSIAGIPSSVNNLREDFAQKYYHTQFDDKNTYHEPAFHYHHNLYGMLMLAYDLCAVSPLDFSTRFAALEESIDSALMKAHGVEPEPLIQAVARAKEAAAKSYEIIAAVNDAYETAVSAGDFSAADQVLEQNAKLYRDLLTIFKSAEDGLVRLTWEDVSSFPHQLPAANLVALTSAVEALKTGDVQQALDEQLFLIDNNWYAYDWSNETYRHFTDYVLEQPAERLMWGTGRVVGHEDLFQTIRSLQNKAGQTDADFSEEIESLNVAIQRQQTLLENLTSDEALVINSLAESLEQIK